MSIDIEMDFDSYYNGINSQLPKAVKEGAVFDLYKLGLSVLDAVSILEGEFLTKCEILELNKKCNYTLNLLIAQHNLDTLEGCLGFTEAFFRSERDRTSIKMSTLEQGIKFNIKSLDEKLQEVISSSDGLNRVENVMELKDFIATNK